MFFLFLFLRRLVYFGIVATPVRICCGLKRKDSEVLRKREGSFGFVFDDIDLPICYDNNEMLVHLLL